LTVAGTTPPTSAYLKSTSPAENNEETGMNSAGVMQRRGFLALVLLGAVLLTVYLVHARLSGGSDPGEAKAAGAVSSPEPSGTSSPNGPAYNAGGDEYGTSTPPASGSASAGAAPVGFTTTSLTGKDIDKMGNVVVDSAGWTTYRFDLDTADPPTSTCFDVCLRSWLPILVDGTPTVIGIDPAKVGVIERPDGGRQATIGGWPLYRFIGDNGPGKWKGQAVNNSWWVVQSTGQRNVSCLPPGAVAPQG
jgi:predicted lipoprotein with Yx(FWY)xxD motif